MLTCLGQSRKHHDGITRRDFLCAGALGLGGLTFADLLRARAQASEPAPTSPKSVIMIFLSGGPSHIDTYDMKPNAPAEIRGEFQPISTNVPGIQICELMPRQAAMMDKLAILRGVQTVGNHTGNEFFSGFAWEQGKPDAVSNQRRPALGSVVSRLHGGRNQLPAYVSLHDNPSWERAYYLGAGHDPFRTFQRERQNPGLDNMRRLPSVSRAQLSDRQSLRTTFDSMRRDLDASGACTTLDTVNAQALDILTSPRVRDAFDLSQESVQVRGAYGSRPAAFDFIPGHDFLLARRLVEAGVPVVTVAIHGWDTHEKNFETLRNQLPIVDRALTALISDLEMRGMLQDVAIIMGGEMGRSPRITRERAGREHWPVTGITVMAGGGLRTGQVVSGSDSRGDQVRGRAITPQMMMATLYQTLGINTGRAFLSTNGRPMCILVERDAIQELL